MGLVTELEAARADMIHAGMTLGLSAPETVQLSQEVDKLLNRLPVAQYITAIEPMEE